MSDVIFVNGNDPFTDNLERAMDREGLNISSLSRKSGVSRQTIHNWISGKHAITANKLRPICKALNCTATDLLGF